MLQVASLKKKQLELPSMVVFFFHYFFIENSVNLYFSQHISKTHISSPPCCLTNCFTLVIKKASVLQCLVVSPHTAAAAPVWKRADYQLPSTHASISHASLRKFGKIGNVGKTKSMNFVVYAPLLIRIHSNFYVFYQIFEIRWFIISIFSLPNFESPTYSCHSVMTGAPMVKGLDRNAFAGRVFHRSPHSVRVGQSRAGNGEH
jgi:hypothetical protein